MEVFLDFGLFEIAAALGAVAMARAVYARKAVGLVFLGVSILAPVGLLFVVPGGAATWLALASAATAVVNGAVVFGALQRGEVRGPTLKARGGLCESGKLRRNDLLAVRTDHNASAARQSRGEVHP